MEFGITIYYAREHMSFFSYHALANFLIPIHRVLGKSDIVHLFLEENLPLVDKSHIYISHALDLNKSFRAKT